MAVDTVAGQEYTVWMRTNHIISSAQVRASRAIMDMTIAEVAKAASIGVTTISRMEAGRVSNKSTQRALKAAFEALGVSYSDAGGVYPPSSKPASVEPVSADA